MGKKAMLFVSVYSCNQTFGGPEEGGWWYTYGHPVQTGTQINPGVIDKYCRLNDDEKRLALAPFAVPKPQTFFNRRNANAAAAKLRDRLDAINDARGPYGHLTSVMCNGAYRCMVEDHPPMYFPQERPYYE